MVSNPHNQSKQQYRAQRMQGIHTRKWYAWIKFSTNPPQRLHVSGEIESTSTALRPFLFKKSYCLASDALCLALVVQKEKGDWPDLDCLVTVRYEEIILGPICSSIHIYLEDSLIEKIPVDIIAA